MTGVLGAGLQLARYGEPVDFADEHRLALADEGAVWLVVDGTLDLFAAAENGRGRWSFLGRIGAGTLVPGSPPRSRYQLVGKPSEQCVLHRVRTADLDDAVRREGGTAHLDLAKAVDTGLRVLLDAVRPLRRPERAVALRPHMTIEPGQCAGPVTDVAWIGVVAGRASSGDGVLPTAGDDHLYPISVRDRVRGGPSAEVTARQTVDLLLEGSLWRHLDISRARVMLVLEQRIDEQDRREEARVAAGRTAGQTAFNLAVRALREHAQQASDQPGEQPEPIAEPVTEMFPVIRVQADETGADPWALAVVRMVAKDAGISELSGHLGEGDARLDPMLRIVRAARLPSRTVGLRGTWWRTDMGPLAGKAREDGTPVALLFRRGRYELVDPLRRFRGPVTAELADHLAPTAISIYRQLPHDVRTLPRLLLFGLRGCRSDLLRLVVSGGVAVVLGLVVPIAAGRILGDFVPNGQRSLIVQTCLAVVVAGIVAMAFGIVQNLAVLRIEGRFETAAQAGVWDRLLRLPTSFFGRYSTGELASAALSVNRIGEVVSGVAMTAVQAALLAVVNLGLQLTYSVPLALMSAGMAGVSALVFFAIAARQLTWQRKLAKLENTLTNKVFQTLRGLPKLRTAAAESYAYAHWAADFIRSQQLHQRVRRLQNAVTAFDAAYVPFCTFVLLMLFVGPAGDAMSADGILTFTVSFAAQLTATGALIGALTNAGSVIPLFGQLEPILAQRPEVSATSRHPGELSGAIEVRNASYRYSPDGPLVLDDVSVTIRPGEFLAVVGPSGCGKSSLLRLLIGFARPATGSVLYDGQDLAGLDLAAVRGQCGVVLQHAQPFTGTILANIRGAESFSLEEVEEAVRMAGLADDVADMPMGLHTVLSDNGSTLSGGQRQRLMIAQALIRKPRMLFLDEATSALDNETQRIVAESTRELKATRVVIAHRLSTVMAADRVIVLSEGRIVQCGPPGELLDDRAGLFHRFVRRQMA